MLELGELLELNRNIAMLKKVAKSEESVKYINKKDNPEEFEIEEIKGYG